MMMSTRLMAFAILFALPLPATPQSLKDRRTPYRLQYNDVITVTFRYTPEFSQDVTIGPDGQAEIAGLGSAAGLGLTLEEFKQNLLAVSSSRLVSPDVTLVLKSYVKPHVMVEGEVNTPGRVEFRSEMSVLDAIALSGGFRDSGAKANILLLRSDESGNGVETHVVNVASLIKQRKLQEVPKLRPGDILYISSTKFSTLEKIMHLGVVGAIYNPIP